MAIDIIFQVPGNKDQHKIIGQLDGLPLMRTLNVDLYCLRCKTHKK